MLLGTVYDVQGKYDQANAQYEQALKIDPQFAEAANNLAWNHAERGGNLDVALTWAQTAKRYAPNNPMISDTLGWIYYRKGIYGLATELLKESSLGLPKAPVAQYHLGMAYYRNGNTAQALETLQRALILKPDFLGAEEAHEVINQLQNNSN